MAHSREDLTSKALAESGHRLAREKKWSEAIVAFHAALELEPGAGLVWGALGYSCEKSGRPLEAMAAYERASVLCPDSMAIAFNLGNVLRTGGRYEEAAAAYRRALDLDPSHVLTWNNLGLVLHIQGRPDEAIACYSRALEIRPEYAEAINNLGSSYVAKNDLVRAKEAYRAALLLEPAAARIQFNLGVAQLLAGEFREGWQGYEHRKRPPYQELYTGKRWEGAETLQGRTILVAFEQGFGDTIQFIRYATLIAEKGARVHLQVQPILKRLLGTVPGVASVVAAGEALPAHETHCTVMSLPHVFGTTLETVPARVPYLSAKADRSAVWASRLGRARPKVGLVWSGNPEHHLDQWRSIPLELLIPAVEGLPVDLVGLVNTPRPADAEALKRTASIRNFGAELPDFAETAALVSQLDLVVSVDTAVAHLSGALAKPTWILLPFAPDFRWMLERTDSPWYPTVRLFRQRRRADWAPVLAELRQALVERFGSAT